MMKSTFLEIELLLEEMTMRFTRVKELLDILLKIPLIRLLNWKIFFLMVNIDKGD